jgi:hypothetical protein
LLGCIAVAAIFFWLLQSPQPAPDQTQSGDQSADANTKSPELAMKPVSPAAPKEAIVAAQETSTNQDATLDDDDPMNTSPEAKHRAYVTARVLELQELGAADDLDSLNTLLSELGNREPEIRKAALDAIVQFDSRDAIPKLEDAELQADDPHEKAAIADAIEFLQLPSITELHAQRNGAAAH